MEAFVLDEDELEDLAQILTGIDTYSEDDPVVRLKRRVYPVTGRAWLLDDEVGTTDARP